MRSVLAGLVLSAVVVGGPVGGQAAQYSPAGEFGLAVGSAATNIVYLPAKVVVAGCGLVVGSIAAVLTGGSTRAAYSVWVPTASGTFILTPEHLDGEVPIQFFGSDYADQPSPFEGDSSGSGYHSTVYRSM